MQSMARRNDQITSAEYVGREELILEHIPQIRYIAQRLSLHLPSNVEVSDLMSEGIFGLLDAVEKFDPTRGVKFKTYAELRIRGAILDSLRNLDWVPRSVRKKSKDLDKAYKRLEQRLGRPAGDKEIADEMGVTLAHLYELMEQVQGLNLSCLQDRTCQDEAKKEDAKTKAAPVSRWGDGFEDLQNAERRNLLADAIDRLPKRERLVISLYYYDDLTMKEIGRVLGVNESRVSQYHSKAKSRLFGKLKKVKEHVS